MKQMLFAPIQSWTPLYTRGLPPLYYYKVFVFTGMKITQTCTQGTQSHYKRYCNAREVEKDRLLRYAHPERQSQSLCDKKYVQKFSWKTYEEEGRYISVYNKVLHIYTQNFSVIYVIGLLYQRLIQTGDSISQHKRCL